MLADGDAAGSNGAAKDKGVDEVEIEVSTSLSIDSDDGAAEPHDSPNKTRKNGATHDAPQVPEDEYSYL